MAEDTSSLYSDDGASLAKTAYFFQQNGLPNTRVKNNTLLFRIKTCVFNATRIHGANLDVRTLPFPPRFPSAIFSISNYSQGFSSDAELDFTETDALPSPAEDEKSSKFKRSGSIYNGFDDGDAHDDAASAAAGTPPVTTTGDDDVGDIGFELSQDEVDAMEMDHKKVYSKDMAFANSMTADEEVKEQELQRLQLEALLRVKGGGDSMDAALSSIDLSALTMSSANASAADTPELKSKREKRKEKGKAKGKAKAVAPATGESTGEGTGIHTSMRLLQMRRWLSSPSACVDSTAWGWSVPTFSHF